MAFALMQRTRESNALREAGPVENDVTVGSRSEWVRSMTSSAKELESGEELWITSAVGIANHSRVTCRRCFNDECDKRKKTSKKK